MAATRRSGGNFDFVYSRSDIARIENNDTSSTKDFKEALREHYKKPNKEVSMPIEQVAVANHQIKIPKRYFYFGAIAIILVIGFILLTNHSLV